jgi:16S rRNA (adenine1518-N6/adenine1519-N6)-dimethyltransferase
MPSTQIALLKKYGLAVRGFKGQHLLIDPNIQRKMVELIQPRPKDWVLEIGPGLGALTAEVLAAGSCVIAVEKDRRFCEILEGELVSDYKGKFFVENADVLKVDLGKLLKQFRRTSNVGATRRVAPTTISASTKIKVVSNLPYYITSPVLFWLIANRAQVEKAVLMMQREVAARLVAQPGNKDYSRLTLGVRYYAEVRRAFEVSRNCFTPKPEVDSSVVTLDFHPPSRLPKNLDEDFLFHIIQRAFASRRKTLLHQLVHDSRLGKSRGEITAVFQKLGIPEKARGEDLLLKDFLSLAETLRLR